MIKPVQLHSNPTTPPDHGADDDDDHHHGADDDDHHHHGADDDDDYEMLHIQYLSIFLDFLKVSKSYSS